MNILLPNHFPLKGSGSGIYTQNVANLLAKDNSKVMTITPEHYVQDEFDFLTKAILFNNGDNEHELDFNFPCFTTHPVSNTTYYELTDAQIREYVDIYERKISEGIKEVDADIIHCGHIWVAPYCASKTGLPLVITSHGTDIMGYNQDERYRTMAHDAAEKADKIIAISKQSYQSILDAFPGVKEKVEIVYNGFNDEVFNLHEVNRKSRLDEFGVPDYEYVVSFIGKFTRFKGIDVLLKAAKIYEARFDSIGTLIVGHGELVNELKNLRDELGLQGVHFLGQQEQMIVSDIYNIADVSTVPSRQEPFGLVAVEALACGTPVVATNEGGLPDFINEKVGALVDVDAPEQLADQIIAAIESNAKEQKGAYCERYAKNNFSWASNVNRLEEIYSSLV